MALANFIDRAATAASQVLANFDLSAFKTSLAAQVVGLAFDRAAVRSAEGAATLDLVVRIVARLYPNIAVCPLDSAALPHAAPLKRLAKAINPAISFSPKRMTACLVVGNSVGTSECPTFYVGSEGWNAKLSRRGPVGSSDTPNPFGAGAAACFGAANVFRTIFAGQLPGGDPDESINLSMMTYSQGGKPDCDWPEEGDIGDVHLVGLGAIGNGAVWALARARGLRGTLHLVDHENVDLSNLQRYVLAAQKHIGTVKVRMAADALSSTELDVNVHPVKWAEYLNSRQSWLFERVAVAVDNAPDRLTVQGALPKWIVNSWTQGIDLGVSRHAFDDRRACLACLYMPGGKVKDEDEQIAEELHMPEAKLEIRTLLQTNKPVDASFVERVAKAFGLSFEALASFEGQPVRSFHQGAICGGHVMRLTNGARSATAIVPMAFQSALAGIMLFADLVKYAADSWRAPTTSTRVNLLRPLAPYLHDPRAKDASGRCICADKDFLTVYRRKSGAASTGT
jgi:hypothetical protein